MKTLLAPLVALTALAGCLGTGAPSDPSAAEALAPPTLPALVPVDLVFESGWMVGGAFEATAHFMPSEEVTGPVWKSGFVLDVTEVPQDLQLRLDWTAAPGTAMLLMAHAPHDDHRAEEKGWSEYTTEFSEASPLCIRIPPEDLLAGYWYVMVHSRTSADLTFTITATTLGGAATILDGPHGHDTNPEELLNIAETETSPKRAWEPCEAP
jgi:hypothetical protein